MDKQPEIASVRPNVDLATPAEIEERILALQIAALNATEGLLAALVVGKPLVRRAEPEDVQPDHVRGG